MMRLRGLQVRATSALKNRLQISRVGPEILLHVARVCGVARALDNQPALPADVGQCLLDFLHIKPGVVLEPHAVLVGGVYLADALAAQNAQLLVQVAAFFERVREIEINLDVLGVDVFEQSHLAGSVEGGFDTHDYAGFLGHFAHYFQALHDGGAQFGVLAQVTLGT
uniref:Uncharacterized protein n=1 Tax=Tanacetum cinerariifolium TaxID=118510 RepID=A0A699QQZ5_TANCI|nr:hypothetical protein [Tanacetum cinerariifolium]